MKRISGGQLSRNATATLLSSHAGDPRTAAGDKSFASQANSRRGSRESARRQPEDLPIGSDVTAQTTQTLTVRAVK